MCKRSPFTLANVYITFNQKAIYINKRVLKINHKTKYHVHNTCLEQCKYLGNLIKSIKPFQIM